MAPRRSSSTRSTPASAASPASNGQTSSGLASSEESLASSRSRARLFSTPARSSNRAMAEIATVRPARIAARNSTRMAGFLPRMRSMAALLSSR
jgi:hypothetical protein